MLLGDAISGKYPAIQCTQGPGLWVTVLADGAGTGGGEDAADVLRYLVVMKEHSISRRKLRGL
jgi:hypothetical protein